MAFLGERSKSSYATRYKFENLVLGQRTLMCSPAVLRYHEVFPEISAYSTTNLNCPNMEGQSTR